MYISIFRKTLLKKVLRSVCFGILEKILAGKIEVKCISNT